MFFPRKALLVHLAPDQVGKTVLDTTAKLIETRRSVGTVCKMSCLLKSLVARYPETDIPSDVSSSTDVKTQKSIVKTLAFRYHPMLARLVDKRLLP